MSDAKQELTNQIEKDIAYCCSEFIGYRWKVHHRLHFLPVMFLELYRGGRSNQAIEFEQWESALSWFVEMAQCLVQLFHNCGCTVRQIYNINAVTWCRMEKFLLNEMADADVICYASDSFVKHFEEIKELMQLNSRLPPKEQNIAGISKYEEELHYSLRNLQEKVIAENPLGREHRLITKLILFDMTEAYFNQECTAFVNELQWNWILRQCTLLAKGILSHEIESEVPFQELRKLEVHASQSARMRLENLFPSLDISEYGFDFNYIRLPKPF